MSTRLPGKWPTRPCLPCWRLLLMPTPAKRRVGVNAMHNHALAQTAPAKDWLVCPDSSVTVVAAVLAPPALSALHQGPKPGICWTMSLSLIATTAAAGTATQQVQHVIDKTLPALIDAVGTEPDEECCMAAVTGMGAILLASGPIACQSYTERIAQAMNTVRFGGDGLAGSSLGAACRDDNMNAPCNLGRTLFDPSAMSIVRSYSTLWATSRMSNQQAPFEQSGVSLLMQVSCSASQTTTPQWDGCRLFCGSLPLTGDTLP